MAKRADTGSSGGISTAIIAIFVLLVVYGLGYYVYIQFFSIHGPKEVPRVESATAGGGLLSGEEYVGQFRHEGKIATPKAASDKYIISTTTESNAACEELKARVTRMCNPVTAKSVDTSVASIGYFCSFNFSCPKEVIDSGALHSLVRPDEIEPDSLVFVEAAPDSWGLDRIDDPTGLDKDYSPTYDGSGQIVYVIDTGIRTTHTEFTGRVAPGKNFHDAKPTEEDGNGHGTHCAGTVLGTKYGVAKNATLVGARVLGDSGSGSTSNIARALAWAVTDWKKNHKDKGCVMSLSLGGGKNSAMNKAVDAASDAGAIVVVAAGNSMSDACNYSPASAGGKARTSFGVISVMSSTDRDKRSSFSNWGSCTDIIAPGSDIKSSWIGGDTAVKTISGTSMATPHVAGVCAQLLQKHNKDKVNAMKELFTIGKLGEIGDVKADSKNQLLQVPKSGVVDGPIPIPPSPPKIQYCVGGTCVTTYASGSAMNEIKLSQFNPAGKNLPVNTKYPIIFLDEWDLADPKACDRVEAIIGKDPTGAYVPMTGAVVFVERGGADDCPFSRKVKFLQNRGAAFVVITQDSTAIPFEPRSGVDEPSIHIWSGMIGRSKAEYIRAAAKAGHKFEVTDTNT